MNPSYKHNTTHYTFEATIFNNALVLSLNNKLRSQEWKGCFTYSQMPASITNSISNLSGILSLFEESRNFIVESITGTVILQVNTIVRNRFNEISIPFQLIEQKGAK